MRLYLTAGGVYVGTQNDARKEGKVWREEIVPTDKSGLIEYLNTLAYKGSPTPMLQTAAETDHLNEEEFASFVEANPSYVDTHNAYKQAERQTQFKTDEIVDFIFDVASVNQVSQIHGAIGTRFAEHLQGTRK